MLPKENRLQKAEDFKAVARKGRSIREGRALLRLQSTRNPQPRFGIVVSKHVAKSAVVRNRIRRLLSEALAREVLLEQEGYDVVLILLPGFQVTDLAHAREIIRKLFTKTSLLKP